MARTAKCCCGAASITVEGDPSLNGICHCDNCKRRTGTAFGWSAYFLTSQVTGTSGKTSVYTVDCEQPQERHFCPTCGTTLYWKLLRLEDLTGIAGGAFVENPLPAPMASYRTAKACSWFILPKDWETH